MLLHEQLLDSQLMKYFWFWGMKVFMQVEKKKFEVHIVETVREKIEGTGNTGTEGKLKRFLSSLFV